LIQLTILTASVLMSELKEARWSVLSERGCEASRLAYGAAAQLVAQLRRERVFGLCIITDEAALRLNHKPAAPPKPAPRKRTPRRKKNA
jgi:hypothetical protein